MGRLGSTLLEAGGGDSGFVEEKLEKGIIFENKQKKTIKTRRKKKLVIERLHYLFPNMPITKIVESKFFLAFLPCFTNCLLKRMPLARLIGIPRELCI